MKLLEQLSKNYVAIMITCCRSQPRDVRVTCVLDGGKREVVELVRPMRDAAFSNALFAEGKFTNDVYTVVKARKLQSKKTFSLFGSWSNKFPSSLLGKETTLELIYREMETMKRFKHPFVLEILGSGGSHDEYWLCFEYFPISCAKMTSPMKDTRLRTAMVLHLFSPIVSAVKAIHDQGFLHLGLHDNAVMFSPDGVPKLYNFEHCVEIGSEDYLKSLAADTYIPFFVAPEIVIEESYGTAADVFSLGLIFVALKRIDPPVLFGSSWDKLVEQYKLKSGIRYDTLQKSIQGSVSDRFLHENRVEAWGKVTKLLEAMLSFQQERRPKMDEILENEVVSSICADWTRFLNGEEASDLFKALQRVALDHCEGRAKPSFVKYVEASSPELIIP